MAECGAVAIIINFFNGMLLHNFLLKLDKCTGSLRILYNDLLSYCICGEKTAFHFLLLSYVRREEEESSRFDESLIETHDTEKVQRER